MRTLRRPTAVAAQVALAFSIALAVSPHRASAITLTQAAAPILVQSAEPYAVDAGGASAGAGDVADLDTKEPTEAVTTNNIVLLVAALGVLIGVLIVTRRKGGPGA